MKKTTNTQHKTTGQVIKAKPQSRQTTTTKPAASRKTRQIIPATTTISIAWISLILCICFSSQSQGVHGIPIGQQQAEMTDLGQGQGQTGSSQQQQQQQQQQLEEFYPLDNEYTRRFRLEVPPDSEQNLNVNGIGNVDIGMNGLNEENQQQPWEMVMDPKFYIHTELEQESQQQIDNGNGNSNNMQQDQRSGVRQKRNAGPSLSIVNPLDVLRQRLLIEIARRRFHSKNQQINANTEYLKTIGRRRR